MRRRGPLALGLACGALAAACAGERSADAGPALSVAVSPTPAVAGPARVLVTLSDGGRPVSGARVALTGRPPDGGAPVLDSALEQRPGGYAAAEFPLDAPGDWRLEARAVLPDGRVAEAAHPILVVGRPSLP